MVRNNLGRLPNVELALKKHAESQLEFQFFRIDQAIVELSTQGQALLLWRIQRKARIQHFTAVLRAYAEEKIAQAT